MSDKITICCITIAVHAGSQRITITPREAVEHKATYVTHDGYSKRMIKKASTHKIDTNMLEKHNLYAYYTWCLFDEREHAIKSLKQHVIKRLETVKAEFEAVYAHKDIINNIVPVIKTDNE
jgi:hypothetical protein